MPRSPKIHPINDLGRPWRTLPRCQAEVTEFTRRWRDHAGKDDQCELRARYVIDGVPYCARHAGAKLVSILTEGVASKSWRKE